MFTTSRNSRTRAHLASRAASGVGSFQKVSMKIESPPANTFQASSAVKLRKLSLIHILVRRLCEQGALTALLREAALQAGLQRLSLIHI